MNGSIFRVWSKLFCVIAIIFGGILNLCFAHGPDDGHGHSHDSNSLADKKNNSTSKANITHAYLYGTLSVFVVSVLSLAGVVFLPCIKQKMAYNSIMLTFMSLAVGTMASDAVLHLIPEALGIHGHSADADHTHDHGVHDDKTYLGKMVALLATFYALYLMELTAHGFSKIVKTKSVVRDAAPDVKPTADKAPSKYASNRDDGANGMEMWSVTTAEANHHHLEHGHHHGHSHSHAVNHTHNICGMKSVAFVVIFSDAMHNFTDGLAIGAAFAKSPASGLAVSLAVVCHELPHEVGDFAILLNSGMSVKRALLLNFLSALTCFAGVYPGIAAGQQDGLRAWIFAVVAGGFLYVALVHLIREIRDFALLPWYLSIALQNIGLLIGFVIVLLLAIYEEDLNNVV